MLVDQLRGQELVMISSTEELSFRCWAPPPLALSREWRACDVAPSREVRGVLVIVERLGRISYDLNWAGGPFITRAKRGPLKFASSRTSDRQHLATTTK